MGAENIRAREAKSNGAPAKEGVGFVGFANGMADLVRSNIQRPEDYGLRRDGFRHALVAGVLFLFTGQCFAVEKQILSTEEADALRAAFNHGDSIGNLLYIGRKHDFTAVKRDGWGIPDLGQFVLQIFLLFFQLTILKEGLVRGIDDEHAIEAIKQHVITGGHVFAGGLKANHGRDTQGTSHNGGVRGLAADIGSKSLREISVQRGGLRRRQVVPYENVWLGEVRKILGAMASEMSEHTAGHITNIGCAFTQVFILHRAKGVRIFLGDLMKGVSDVDLFGFYETLYLLQQRGIL